MKRSRSIPFGWIGLGLGIAIAGAAVGAVKLRSERPIVVINGEKITQAKFQAQLEKENGGAVLRRMIEEKLVLQAAKQKGLLPTNAQVQAEITQMRERDPDLERQLRLRGKSMDELTDDIHGRLAMANLIAADVKLPDGEAKKLWAAYAKKFERPEGRKIAMVLAKTNEIGIKARGQMEAGIQAEFVAQSAGMALPGGRSQLSVFRGQLPPAVEGQIFGLKPGAVSNVLHLGKTFVVVKMLEPIPASKKNFDQVKDRLLLAAKLGKGKNQMDLMRDLQKSAKIEFQSTRYNNILETVPAGSGAKSTKVARAR